MEKTRRKHMFTLLKERAYSIRELSEYFGVNEKIIEKDIQHMQRSLRRDQTLTLYVLPARCARCEFEFRVTSLKTPSRCPKCKNERIQPALVKIE